MSGHLAIRSSSKCDDQAVSDEATVRRRFENALDQILALPGILPGVAAIALVGSSARGAARQDSDIDVVLLTALREVALTADVWLPVFGGGATLVRSADFGAIQERRVRLSNGLVIEVGVGEPAWATARPVDPGTERVTRDGMLPIHDPNRLLADLIRTVKQSM